MTERKTTAAETTKVAANSPATKTARRRTPLQSTALASAAPTVQLKTSKRDQLAALLVRDEGATIAQMMALTGWLAHTTRAALTGLKKLGHAIDSDKIDGLRTYRAVAPK